MGGMDRDASFRLLDAFFEAGGNFLDTANNYQNDVSESCFGLGDLRGVRGGVRGEFELEGFGWGFRVKWLMNTGIGIREMDRRVGQRTKDQRPTLHRHEIHNKLQVLRHR